MTADLVNRPVWDETEQRYVWRLKPRYVTPVPVVKCAPKFSWWRERERLESIGRWLVSYEMGQVGARRLHVVGSRQSGLTWHNTLGGLAGADLGDSLRKAIGRRWRGIDPTVLVDDRPPDLRFDTLEDWRVDRAAITVHEIIHLIQFFPRWAIPNQRRTAAEKFVSVELCTQADSESREQMDTFPKWFHHDWNFVRLALHGWHRVHKHTGMRAQLLSLMSWDKFGYAHPWDYFHASIDEIERLASVPLSVVKTIAPPEQFLDIWAKDTGTDPRDSFTLSQPALAAHS